MRHGEAEGSAGCREENALGEELAHEPHSFRAECGADRDFASSARRAGEQEVRDVRARDEQHEPDRTEQHEQRRPHASHDDAVHCVDLNAAVPLLVGKIVPDALCDGRHLRGRRSGIHARLEPPDDGHPMVAALFRLALRPEQWEPDVVADRADRESKLGGITPMTVYIVLSSEMSFPTIARSAPKRRRQKPSLSTTTGLCPGWSSSGVNVRPSAGVEPSTLNRLAVARTPRMRSGFP